MFAVNLINQNQQYTYHNITCMLITISNHVKIIQDMLLIYPLIIIINQFNSTQVITSYVDRSQ